MPVSLSGIIGDWGGTFYMGSNPKINEHMKLCLDTVEEIADFCKVAMEYGDISRFADKLLIERRLSTDRTLLINGRRITGTNCGHTIPWTDKTPSDEELGVLARKDQTAINDLISSKRLFVNASEQAKIPPSVAFTTELRLESLEDPTLPNVFFHLVVTFVEGTKKVVTDYNQVFDYLGMKYIRARF